MCACVRVCVRAYVCLSVRVCVERVCVERVCVCVCACARVRVPTYASCLAPNPSPNFVRAEFRKSL